MAEGNIDGDLNIPVLEGKQKYHAFISHSTEDKDFAYKMTEKLEKLGFKCFMYERDLPPDSTIVTGVVENMKVSRRVILVMTEAFIASRWSLFEAMEAMTMGYDLDRLVLVPVLYQIEVKQIPHYLRPYICLEEKDEHFWGRLTKALIEDRPAASLVPAGNVAHGLAWSYFYGFLNLVLPGIRERSKEWIKTLTDPPKMLMKALIITPSSCKCPQEVTDLAPQLLTFVGFIEFNVSRAGNKERSYKSSVYKIRDPGSKEEFLFIAEFATPLLSMYEMETEGLAGLDTEAKIHQRMLFSDKLLSILSHPRNISCHNKATVMEYEDETEEKRMQFPKLLCEHIRRELKKEEDIADYMEKLKLADGDA